MKSKTTKAAGKASLRPLVLRRPSNAELLRQIGEIDGIMLRHVGEHTLAVSIDIGGRSIDVIRDSGSWISHHITRIGLGEALAQNAALTGGVLAVPSNGVVGTPNQKGGVE